MATLTLTIGDQVIPVASLQEASEAYCRLRDESGQGASLRPYSFVSGAGLGVYVSYNGRVWNEAGSCLYDPIPNTGPAIPSSLGRTADYC